MSLKLSLAIALLGFSLSASAATSNCYSDANQKIQVGTLQQDGRLDTLVLNLTQAISSEDTDTKIPAGTYDLNDSGAVNGVFSCHDGVELVTNRDEAEGDQLYLNLEVRCDLHPHFPTYNFNLICE